MPRRVAFRRASVGFTSYVPSNLSRVSTSGGLTKVCPSYLHMLPRVRLCPALHLPCKHQRREVQERA